MTEFFFPDNKCGVGNKVEKVDFNFVEVCALPPTPPPIFDCQLPLIVREPEIPCPTFVTSSKIAVGYGGDNANCPLEPPSRIDFKINKKPNDECPTDTSCRFEADIDIAVLIPPPPCPDTRVNTFKVTSFFQDELCATDNPNRFSITTNKRRGNSCDDPGTCEILFDLEIGVPIPRPPCPEITINNFYVDTVYNDECKPTTSRFAVAKRHRPPTDCNDTGDCAFEFDLEIVVPIPRPPCPDIKISSFKVGSGYDNVEGCARQNIFTVRKTARTEDCVNPQKRDQCDFEIDLEIFIPIPNPPCPEINVRKFDVKSFYTQRDKKCAGQSRFEITTKKTTSTDCRVPDKCEFDIELEIAIPIPVPPCPTISIGKFEVKTHTTDCPTNTNRFEVIAKRKKGVQCDEPDQCDFEINLEIDVPIPVPPCPAFNIKTFNVKTFYEEPEKCVPQDIGNTFTISRRPAQQPDCKDSNNNTPPDNCDFDIEFEINIPLPPPPPCPTISIGTFEVKTHLTGGNAKTCDLSANKFEVVPKGSVGTECGEKSECDFEINLEIDVPIPRPPCPTFNIKTFDVKTFYATDKCAPDDQSNVFKIEKRETDPVACEQQENCDFDIDLLISIPIPPPFCPDISVGEFSVNYVDGITVENIDKLADTGCNKFLIKRKQNVGECGQPTGCDFEFDLAICIPVPPCPTFNVKTFTVTSGYVDCVATKENKFEITKNPASCDFDLDLEIVVPIPRPVCPIFGTNLSVFPFFFGGNCLPGLPVPACPAGGGGGNVGGPFNGESWFTVEPVEIGGCCNEGDGQVICGFLFDLGISIPIPKLVQEITFDPQKITFDLTWCEPNINRPANKITWAFPQQPDPWVNCCDRGSKAEFKPTLNIEYTLDRWPCEYIDLWPDNFEFPIELVDSNGVVSPAPEGTFLKLRIEPKPPLGPCQPCRWEFIPELRIPKICDKFEFVWNKTDTRINPCYYTCYADFETCTADPSEWLTLYFEQDASNACKFNFWFYAKPPIYAPCEKVEYIFNAAESLILPFYCNTLDEIKTQSVLDINITQDAVNCCKYNVSYYLRLGVLRPICSGTVNVKDYYGNDLGSGTLTCVTNAAGLQEYQIDITLATKDCAANTGG